MAAVRSEFLSEPNPKSSSPSQSDRLRAVKNQVTTCLQQLRQKLHQLHQHHQQQPPASFRKSSSRSRFYRIFVKADYPALGVKSKLVRQFQRILKAGRKGNESAESVTQSESEWKVPVADERHRLQFVARLFSSTLIATEEVCLSRSGSGNGNGSGNGSGTGSGIVSESETKKISMTIIESNYIAVREEFPDIDAEVRAILLAHAQNGITISSIKSEYRKLTGCQFPLHENITDFLLTIPHVTAECCETGTRIFNLKPSKENRHLYEMVLAQKQRGDFSSGPPSSVDEHPKFAVPRVPPRNWRYQYKRKAVSPLPHDDHRKHLLRERNVRGASDDKENVVPANSATLQQMAKAAGESNWCYQDNWNHLNNFYQQSNANAPPKSVPRNSYEVDAPKKQTPFAVPEMHHHNKNLNLSQNTNHQPVQDMNNNQQQDRDERIIKRRETTPTATMTSGTNNDSLMTISSGYDAFLLDFPLMGDDFFLYLARMELCCRFRRYERVLQSGLCASGQTIIGARNRLRKVYLPEGTQIIINIGSVDIMRGKPLVQIEHDFRLLIKEMHSRRFVPILTTLAPLANYCHDKAMCDKINRFNKFIRSEARGHLKVIDIHSCLINESKIVHFDCYQSAPRTVTGSKEPYLFWNKIGRQRVLQMIESCLEY
ncbi:hypothetical protein KR018_011251 [Drosophila ironensis]|nr:hypothetical protein KR018_011251 [Drosophila ironensis]